MPVNTRKTPLLAGYNLWNQRILLRWFLFDECCMYGTASWSPRRYLQARIRLHPRAHSARYYVTNHGYDSASDHDHHGTTDLFCPTIHRFERVVLCRAIDQRRSRQRWYLRRPGAARPLHRCLRRASLGTIYQEPERFLGAAPRSVSELARFFRSAIVLTTTSAAGTGRPKKYP